MKFINTRDTDQRKHSRKKSNHRIFSPQKIPWGRCKRIKIGDAENLRLVASALMMPWMCDLLKFATR